MPKPLHVEGGNRHVISVGNLINHRYNVRKNNLVSFASPQVNEAVVLKRSKKGGNKCPLFITKLLLNSSGDMRHLIQSPTNSTVSN